MIHMDFETYSEANLKIVGAHHYAMHQSTDVLCLSYAFDDEEPQLWVPGDWPPDNLFNRISDGDLVHAFNTAFEFAIWEYVCKPRLHWPTVPFMQWRDTQAQALLFAYPMALDKCAEAMHLPHKKDPRGNFLIRKLSVPQKITKKNKFKRLWPETHPELFGELYEYCKQDVIVERAVHNTLPWDLEGQELDIWRLALLKNNRGIPIDKKLVDSIVEKVDNYLEEITSMVPVITGGAINTIGQRDKIILWCKLNGYKLNDMTAETVTEALEDEELPAKVRSLLEIRQLAGKSSIKKFKKIQEALCWDDRIRDCLKYHRATTGREGGRLLQPQNLPRATVDDTEHAINSFINDSFEDTLGDYDNLIYAASALIRPSIKAPEGKEIKVADYSSIENCTAFWLAGEDWALDMIRKGLCLYTDMATDLYHVSYEQVREEYYAGDDHKRRHGKVTILGAVYGMGHDKFYRDCISRGLEISPEEAKRTIDIFREKYSMVKKWWYGLKNAATEACRNPNNIHSYRFIQFIHMSGHLFMVLPNGKMICYPEARVEIVEAPWGKTEAVTHMGAQPKTKKWTRLSITPGRFGENSSQATAREVLMEATLDLERAGYEHVLTVHDESVTLDDIGFGSIEDMSRIMCDRSIYFEGLPLKVDGFITERYKK